MKTSTATSVFVNYKLGDAIDQVIKAGFDGIDIWCGRPHLFRQDFSKQEIQKLRQKIEDSNLQIASLMPAFYRYPFSLSSPIEEVRIDSIAYMKDCINNAENIGANRVLVVPTRSLFGQSVEDARSLFMDSLEKVCSYASQLGIMLGLEILNPQLTDYMATSTDAIRMIRELNHPCLGVIIDTGHLNLTGEKQDTVLRTLGDTLLQVHINDNNGKEQQNSIPGDGNFDFENLLALLRQNGYDDFLSLELGWHYSFEPFPSVCQALSALHGYITKADL